MSEAISVFLGSDPTDIIATAGVLLIMSFWSKARRKGGQSSFNIFGIFGMGGKK